MSGDEKAKRRFYPNCTSFPNPTPNGKEVLPSAELPELIYLGDSKNTSLKEFNLTGCTETKTLPQTYSLKLPANWTIMKVHQSFDEMSFMTGENPSENFYYSAEGNNKMFAVGCMTLGSKGIWQASPLPNCPG